MKKTLPLLLSIGILVVASFIVMSLPTKSYGQHFTFSTGISPPTFNLQIGEPTRIYVAPNPYRFNAVRFRPYRNFYGPSYIYSGPRVGVYVR